MKKRNLQQWVLPAVVVFGMSLVAMADDGPPDCPPPPDCDSETPPCDCPDPAFLGVDRAPLMTLSESKARQAQLAGGGNEAILAGEEAAVWKDIEQRMAADPEKCFSVAREVWEGNFSETLQRMAILRAKRLASTTDEMADLDFMLACLEDASAQKELCLKLGRGNGLERNQGARKLALLTSNPSFGEL